MAKTLKFTFKVNGKNAGALKLPVNESIHMDIMRKVTDFAQKAYSKTVTDKNTVHGVVEIDRQLTELYDAFQDLADIAISGKPINASLNLPLREPENIGDEISCRISL